MNEKIKRRTEDIDDPRWVDIIYRDRLIERLIMSLSKYEGVHAGQEHDPLVIEEAASVIGYTENRSTEYG